MATTLAVSNVVIDGRKHVTVLVSETSATTTSDVEITDIPIRGTIVGFTATLTAGTGTTINPGFGLANGFTDVTQDSIGRSTTTSVNVQDQTELRYDTSNDTDGSIWIQWAVDAATDNTVFAQILIVEGWVI